MTVLEGSLPFFDPDKRDLHEIINAESLEMVAVTLNMSSRKLIDIRQGKYPLTMDAVVRLRRGWPDFDLQATVWRLGELRKAKGLLDTKVFDATADDLYKLQSVGDRCSLAVAATQSVCDLFETAI